MTPASTLALARSLLAGVLVSSTSGCWLTLGLEDNTYGRGADGGCTDTLSDAGNCGACGHSCLGGACELGHCMPVAIATDLAGPAGVAVAGDTIYVSERNAGNVVSISLSQPSSTPVPIATGQQDPAHLALVASFLFWTTQVGGTVMRRDLTSGDTKALASSEAQATGIAADVNEVYFTTQKGNTTDTVSSVPTTGGTVTPIVSNLNQPEGIALTGSSLYLATQAGGTVDEYTLTGMFLSHVAGAGTPVGVALDGQTLYFTDQMGGVVYRQALDDRSSLVAVARDQAKPTQVAVDATSIYWANLDDGRVMRLAK